MTSKDIVRAIVAQIFAGTLVPNDKLPSEMQLSIKYDVSRIVATRAYHMLKQIGAIYSIPKKGFFVAQYFSGIMRSIDVIYATNHLQDDDQVLANAKFLRVENIVGNFKTFGRRHYKNDVLMAVSQFWINAEVQHQYVTNHDFIADMISANQLTKATKMLKFEKFPAFGQDTNLVISIIYYHNDLTVIVQRVAINPRFFRFTKNEWAI